MELLDNPAPSPLWSVSLLCDHIGREWRRCAGPDCCQCRRQKRQRAAVQRHGSFQPQQTFAVGGARTFVTAADINQDGKQDLIVANHTSNTVSILLGNGDGTFQPQRTIAVGPGPSSVAVADMNDDGKLDLAVGNEPGRNVGVFLEMATARSSRRRTSRR